MVFIDADVSCILYISLLAKPKLRIAGQVCVVAVAGPLVEAADAPAGSGSGSGSGPSKGKRGKREGACLRACE